MNKYLQFLSRIVFADIDDFSLLLKHLHEIEFYSMIPNDDNRGEDGKKLREIFMDEEGPHGSFCLPDGPCTVLEMLIGLSYRMENELEGGPYRTPAPICFWIFLKNLGLDWASNDDYYQNAGDDAVNEIIGSFLDRTYERNGDGGLFPLKKTYRNQRKVEIWYQMQEYLLENYF